MKMLKEFLSNMIISVKYFMIRVRKKCKGFRNILSKSVFSKSLLEFNLHNFIAKEFDPVVE